MRFGRHPAILSASGSSASFMRALQPAAWFRADTGVTVTGLGASTWADQSGNGRDLLQSTDASRPPYLSYSGTKYLYLPGVAGNYASTPDSVPASITGDIDIRIRVALKDWTPSAAMILVSKMAGAGARSYQISVSVTTGTINFLASVDGAAVNTSTSSAAPTITDGATLWLRATRASATGKVNFYTAADSSTEPASWSALGTEQTQTSGSIFDSATQLAIGVQADGTTSPTWGNVYRASIYSTIGGTTPVVDFNPDLDGSDQAATITSSATGEVWTINKSGGLPAQIVGRPSLLFDGSADYLKCNAFTLNQPETVYLAFKQVSWTIGDVIFTGNGVGAECQLSQRVASPQMQIYAGTLVAANGNLAVGSYGAVACVFNGASSVLRVNNTTETTGNAGAQNPGGFTLGVQADNLAAFCNIQVLEVIIFSAAHDATQRARVVQYLAGRHGVAL